LHIFGKKQAAHCAVCNKELGRHKYKPSEEWKIEGLLCGDCHIEKTKEFMLHEQAQEQETPDRCAACNIEMADGSSKKPRWQWNMEPGTLLCAACFQKKEADYEKKVNFCAVCNTKMGFVRYNPKPAWKIQGQLCRKCWDERKSRGD
jgi:hypothetical protein